MSRPPPRRFARLLAARLLVLVCELVISHRPSQSVSQLFHGPAPRTDPPEAVGTDGLLFHISTLIPCSAALRAHEKWKKAGRSVKPKRTDLRITANVDSILLMILLIHVRYPLLSWLAS